MSDESLSVPVDEFYCPITNSVMEDPVMSKYGHSFDRTAIVEWLQNNPRCPLTNQPLSVADLFPNRALKTMIDTHRAKLQPKRPPKPLPQPAAEVVEPALRDEEKKQDHSVIVKCYVDNLSDEKNLHVVELSAPNDGEPLSMAVVLSIDISGSMGDLVYVKGEDGSERTDGLTKLDLVKHAALTIIQTLRDQDRLGLVVYDNRAELLLKCTAMNEDGKKEASLLVKNLAPRGSTNLWDGLRVSLVEIDRVAAEHVESVNRHVMVLTDGVPNMSPPRGEIQTLQVYLKEHTLNCAIHAFGFGYSLISEMLQKIAIVGQGSYAFIPDGTFVGTAFINAMAYAMTTVARDVVLTVPGVSAEHNVFPEDKTTDSTTIQVGCLGLGQSKFVAFKGDPSQLAVSFRSLSGSAVRVDDICLITDQGNVRSKHLKVLQAKKMLQKCDLEPLGTGPKVVEKAIAALNGETDKDVEDFAIDLKGQVSEAFSRSDWLLKWGYHYIRSLSLAHVNRVCVNFKDPGLQHYGGVKFNELRDKFEAVFLTIEAPKPSKAPASRDLSTNGSLKSSVKSRINNVVHPVNMASYYNSKGVCFPGNTRVQLSSSEQSREVQHLKKGDVVRTGRGGEAAVVCVVETVLDGPCEIVRIGEIGVTSWHPIRNQDSGEWSFPAELHPENKALEAVGSVFNVVLDQGHELLLCDKTRHVRAVTLGHGFSSNPVVSHAYFGTEAVVNDLRKYAGWDSGFVQIHSSHIHHDPLTALICRISPQ